MSTIKKYVGIKVLSPAKINTFLHVHQQDIDGFHQLITHFQLINLYDELYFTVNDSGNIYVDNPKVIVARSDELCYRAAYLLQSYTNKKFGVDITVKKNIPYGAGLGGGSSNAATVLVVLNKLCKLGLSQDELLYLGLKLGSDVPIFIHGRSSLAMGRGEKFINLNFYNPIKNKSLFIVKPNICISTKDIFQSKLLKKRDGIGKISTLNISNLIYKGENDFAPVVFSLYPDMYLAAEHLSVYSPARLTGTGACLYAVLDETKKTDKMVASLGRDYQLYFLNTIDRSPLSEF